MKSLFKYIFVYTLLGVFFSSCYDSDDHQPDGDAFILSFSIDGNVGYIDGETKDIVVYLPLGTDVTELSPVVVTSMNASIAPGLKDEIDFSSPVDFTVISKNGAQSNTYKVTIRNQENRVKKLEAIYNEIAYSAVINDAKNIITLNLPSFIEDLSQIRPIVTVAEGAKVELPSEFVDLSEGKEVAISVDYKGYKNVYRLVAQHIAAPEILKLKAGGSEAVIDQSALTITIPFGLDMDISAIVPEITLSDETVEVVSPADYQDGIDFATPDLKLVIKNSVGDIREYAVVVRSVLLINSFVFELNGYSYRGVIDNEENTIRVFVPISVAVTNLSPTVTTNTTGAKIEPASNTAQDFSSPVSYTISKGEVTMKYTVEVIAADLKIGFLGVWPDEYSITNEDELVAFNWFKKTYPKGQYISFTDIKNGLDLSFFKVLWWHNDQYQKLPAITSEVENQVKNYYANGGSLFLSTFATQYIKTIGVSKDGLAPNSVGQNPEPIAHPWGNGLSVNGYESHPIFEGLDIWDFGDAIKRFYLLFDNTWRMEKHSDWAIGQAPYATIDTWREATGARDLGGYEWESTRANGVTMAEFPKNNKGKGEGAVICLGSIAYDWHVDHKGLSDYVPNNFQDRIQILTQKTLDYLYNQ